MKQRIMAFLLVLALGLCFVGCGSGSASAEPDPNEGLYTAVRAGNGDLEIDASALFTQGFTLELKSGGKCAIAVDGDTGSGKWTLENGALTITEKGTAYHGTLADGILRLEDLDGEGLYVIFTKEGVSLYDAGRPADMSVDNSWWTRDWYGWWHVTNCTGEYENWEDNWWNACAHIEGRGDQLQVIIWDQDLPRDNAVAEFSLQLGADGSAVSGRGYYMDMGLEGGELNVAPSSVRDDVLYLDLHYAVGKGAYEVDAMFKPWGATWDDVSEDDIPYLYESWYLPLIQSGVTEAPDTITAPEEAG